MSRKKKQAMMPPNLEYGECPFFGNEDPRATALERERDGLRNAVIDECIAAIRAADDCRCGVPCDCFGVGGAIAAVCSLRREQAQ